MNKTISIVTICYNSQDTIENCIDSIICQLSKDVEYIIIDGKSTDKTVEIINKKILNNKYVTFKSERDKGIYDAMNKGAKIASGKYILFINSDDELLPGVIKKVLPMLKKSEDDVVYGNVLFTLNYENKKYVSLRKYGAETKEIKKRMIVHHQATFTKKSILEKINYFDTSYKICGDYDSFIRIYNNGGVFKHIDQTIAFFSLNGASSTKPVLSELYRMRKKNKAYPYRIIFDFIGTFLVKTKTFAKKKFGFDLDVNRIKRGKYHIYCSKDNE